MNVTDQYDAVMKALWTTPPAKRLAALIRAEDNEEPMTNSGKTRREVVAQYVKSEFGKIVTAIRDTEKAMRGEK